jgi:hypothetical protein
MTRIQLHGPLTVNAMAPVPHTVLDRLRDLLASGVEAQPDRQRPNFYTVNDDNRSTYFYISPVTAKVWVLESRVTTSVAETAQMAAHSA